MVEPCPTYRHRVASHCLATVPECGRLILRRARTLQALADADEVIVWREHETGPVAVAADAWFSLRPGEVARSAWTNVGDPAAGTKSPEPVFATSEANSQYGPGHNSSTAGEDGTDLLVYHARQYREIEGDPLLDPNRHTRVQAFHWKPG
ncbi:hypothetical protein E1161_10945 [Saccharopolyspora aridisoli]|uniref:Uncharacterized protein n=1 Tax=Saccharopolyspora aridisoli TaxID=2530385 RepID=A0A4R4USY8_9PSEU|nr:family 43 glycosylhydrolase [Saccharopolyspora aridisoli]TDC93516.1 hypothetical protein E1161_10945 [Saccharopolyspora aridisoli]